jgi:serine/threonine protein kinase
MVVMDYLDDSSYIELFDIKVLHRRAIFAEEVQKKVKSLHEANFVHGDIRTTNIMVKKKGEQGIMLIDFDWAGETGKTVYPMNINRAIRRPDGARGGKPILAEHDIAMIEIAFENLNIDQSKERPGNVFWNRFSTLPSDVTWALPSIAEHEEEEL